MASSAGLDESENAEELQHAGKLAAMVRKEAYDKIVASARRRGANAIVKFEYKSEVKMGDFNGPDTVIVGAVGLAVSIRKLLSDRERRRRARQLEYERVRALLILFPPCRLD